MACPIAVSTGRSSLPPAVLLTITVCAVLLEHELVGVHGVPGRDAGIALLPPALGQVDAGARGRIGHPVHLHR